MQDYYKDDYVRYYVKPVIRVGRRSGDPDTEPGFELSSPDGPMFRRVASYRFFRCQKVTYIWDESSSRFYANHGLDVRAPLSLFHQQVGLSAEEQKRRWAEQQALDAEMFSTFICFQTPSVRSERH